MNLRHVLCGGRIHDSGLSRCLSQIKAHYMCERTAVRVALFITDICCLTSSGLWPTDVTLLLDTLLIGWCKRPTICDECMNGILRDSKLRVDLHTWMERRGNIVKRDEKSLPLVQLDPVWVSNKKNHWTQRHWQNILKQRVCREWMGVSDQRDDFFFLLMLSRLCRKLWS